MATKKQSDKEVWDKPNPKKKSDKLTPEQKSEAKARAKKAGRPYPNLVDNMAVSKKDKK
jgi:hypothetical protein